MHVVFRRQQVLCGWSEMIKEIVAADAVREVAGGHGKAFDFHSE